MRVAHVVADFPPYRGGMGTVAFHQAKALATAGVDVTVFTRRSAVRRSPPPGANIVELPALASFGNAACLPQVPGRIGASDLIHLHYPFFGTAELVAIRRLLMRQPLVLQYQMDSIGEGWRGRIFHWHSRLLLPLVLRASDKVIVSSRDYATASRLARWLPALDDRLVVIPNGVDLEHFSPEGGRLDARRRLGLPADEPIVFFLARLDRAHYFKDLPVLLEAASRLPDVTLVIGGDGELRAEYESQAAHLGRQARFVGDIPDDMLPVYYRAADVVTVPSLNRTEAYGLVLIEAMACGTPVVASRLPGVRTLIDEGRTGFLVEPGDAADLTAKIRRCITEGASFGASGRDFVATRFSWTAITQQLISLYREVVP